MSSERRRSNLDIASVTKRDAPAVARKLASDPEGMDATGTEAPREEAALERLIRNSIEGGGTLWRIRIGDDLFGAVVGDDPFADVEPGMFIWLDPRHRGNDLGIRIVADAVKRFGEEGRERVVVRPPRSNYAALRILNALEFVYVGEEPVERDGFEPRIRFERGTRGGPGVPDP